MSPHRNREQGSNRFLRVGTIIRLLSITIIDGSRGVHTAETPVASSLYSCQITLAGGVTYFSLLRVHAPSF